MDKKKIIIVGAGYGGIRLARKLAGFDGIEVTVIDQNSYHYLQTDVYDYIANKTNMSDITVDLFTLFASYNGKINFFQEEVIRVDYELKKVITHKNRYRYDYLVLAAGSRTLLPESIPGLKEYYHGIKSFPNALRFKQRFEEYMFRKIETEGVCKVESNLNIVIGGGGLSGVEIATEMSHYATSFYQNTGYLCGGVNIVLINSSDKVLKGLNGFLQDEAMARLEELNIKVLKNKRVTKVEEHSVYLNDGSSVNMDFLIWTGGIRPSDLIKSMNIEKNKAGQILIDEYFRTKKYKDVFAIGDCAEVHDPKNKERVIPPTAQAAELAAAYVAKNIKNDVSGREMEKGSVKLQGMFVALGGTYGSGVILDTLKFSSKIGFVIKKIIEHFYKHPLKKRCKKGYRLMMEG